MRDKVFSTDEDLWAAFKDNDEAAYELIFRENQILLINYGLKFINDKDEVKDCVQQLFASLWESRKRLGSNNCIKGYLLASIRRMILRRSKRKSSFTNFDHLNHKFLLEVSAECMMIHCEKEQERVRVLKDMIEILPIRQKEAIHLRFYEGYGFTEISEMMGITIRVVYKLIYKAIAKIKDQLDQHQLYSKSNLMLAAS